MLSRRGFLIGAAGLLTAAFVKDAGAFLRKTKQPLLTPPPQVTQTLYWYDNGDNFLLTLGEYQFEPPPLPTWREYFVREGIAHRTKREAYEIWADHMIWPDGYDEPMDERYWHDLFDLETGPCAKAYRLLSDIDIGPELESERGRTCLEFVEGSYPGDNSLWVSAGNRLAISLLQARLIDLNLPIKIAKGGDL